MVQRVVTFFAACVIAGASVSLTVCQLLCASHQHQPTERHAHRHSCAPSSASTEVAALPHACGHDDSDNVAVVKGTDISPMLAVVSPMPLWTMANDAAPRLVALTPTEYRPPGLLADTIQLRV